jgi:hypothetical protein
MSSRSIGVAPGATCALQAAQSRAEVAAVATAKSTFVIVMGIPLRRLTRSSLVRSGRMIVVRIQLAASRASRRPSTIEQYERQVLPYPVRRRPRRTRGAEQDRG